MTLVQQPEFGTRLRELRARLGLSQHQLAEPGISAGYLSRLESGARPPTVKVVAYLAERLGVTPEAFHASRTDALAEALAVAGSVDDAYQAADERLRDALNAGGDEEPAVRWQALRFLAAHQRRRGDREEELETLGELAELADRIGAPELRACSHLELARCLRALGQMHQAHENADRAVSIAAEHQLALGHRIGALMVLISVEAVLGRLPEARAHAAELERLAEDAPPVPRTEALWTTAHVHVRLGDHVGAADRLGIALELLSSGENPLLWLRLRLAAASLNLQMTPRRLADADRRLTEAAVAVDLIGQPLHRQEYLLLRAQLAFHQHEPARARAICDELAAGPLLIAYHDRVTLDVLRARLQIVEGAREAGFETLRALAQQAEGDGNLDLSKEIWRALAETLADSS